MVVQSALWFASKVGLVGAAGYVSWAQGVWGPVGDACDAGDRACDALDRGWANARSFVSKDDGEAGPAPLRETTTKGRREKMSREVINNLNTGVKRVANTAVNLPDTTTELPSKVFNLISGSVARSATRSSAVRQINAPDNIEEEGYDVDEDQKDFMSYIHQ